MSEAIKVEHVSKHFKLPYDKAASLKSSLVNLVKRRRGYEMQHALEDVSFEIGKGEFFGIVGKNGGGKSTLLKIISGIYTPTSGNVQINGKLTPFIELGVGFNPELTGRENVFLNGALLGFNRTEMGKMYKEIVDFAELEKFMDQKLKNYSSGMQVRLAFSIAIRSQSDILVMDEVLAVGDAAFQKKCVNTFRELKKQGRTIVLVTHDMGNVERFCDRVLVLDEGKQLTVTTPAEAASIYAQLNVDEKELDRQDTKYKEAHKRRGNGNVKVKKHSLMHNGKPTQVFQTGEEFTINLELERRPSFKNLPVLFGLSFHGEDDLILAGPNNINVSLNPSANNVSYTIPNLPFAPGDYRLTLALFSEDMTELDLMEKWVHFTIVSDHQIHGVIELKGRWLAE